MKKILTALALCFAIFRSAFAQEIPDSVTVFPVVPDSVQVAEIPAADSVMMVEIPVEDCIMAVEVLKRPTDELNFSLAYFTYPQVQYLAGGVLVSIIAGLFGVSGVPTVFFAPGALGVEYDHYFGNVVALGGGVALDYVLAPFLGSGLYVSVLPDVKFRWLYRNKLRMYSKLSAGCSVGFGASIYSGETTPHAFFAWELTALGFEFNTSRDDLKMFFDLGIGTQGLFSFGIKKDF